MHDLAVAARIQKIEPIEGKDRIVLATICNYKSIVEKGAYNAGDLAIYVFYDSILPDRPEFEFLRKRCWSEKYKGHRIRPMKMGNVISEGLVLPLSLCPEAKEGEVLTEKLGIRLYEADYIPQLPPKQVKGLRKHLMKYAFFRRLLMRKTDRSYPVDIPKSDEENIEKVYDAIKDSKESFIITEKVEGASAMYYVKRKLFSWDYRVHSHNFRVIDGAWADYSKKNDVKAKLIAYARKHKLKEVAVSGELIGPKIQKNIYKRDVYELYLFNAYTDKGRLSWDTLVEVSKETGIPTVPYIGTFQIKSLDEMLFESEGASALVLDGSVPREGVVWRDNAGVNHFKVKSRPYKVWFGK